MARRAKAHEFGVFVLFRLMVLLVRMYDGHSLSFTRHSRCMIVYNSTSSTCPPALLAVYETPYAFFISVSLRFKSWCAAGLGWVSTSYTSASVSYTHLTLPTKRIV
eukprot:TRINITY_DN16458_c0_g1_i11.p1 TRINITY_DN16458_c0_g1~~TRINITY_DN16458_c0_g1_i11.p1  ORF type:complete len:106 (+),score=11.38 TRINITY_DN16458_c0_g1_i11:230-547(+)